MLCIKERFVKGALVCCDITNISQDYLCRWLELAGRGGGCKWVDSLPSLISETSDQTGRLATVEGNESERSLVRPALSNSFFNINIRLYGISIVILYFSIVYFINLLNVLCVLPFYFTHMCHPRRYSLNKNIIYHHKPALGVFFEGFANVMGQIERNFFVWKNINFECDFLKLKRESSGDATTLFKIEPDVTPLNCIMGNVYRWHVLNLRIYYLMFY